MPAPMIAPMPSSTRFTGPSARLRLLVRFDLGLERGHILPEEQTHADLGLAGE